MEWASSLQGKPLSNLQEKPLLLEWTEIKDPQDLKDRVDMMEQMVHQEHPA